MSVILHLLLAPYSALVAYVMARYILPELLFGFFLVFRIMPPCNGFGPLDYLFVFIIPSAVGIGMQICLVDYVGQIIC